MKLKLHTSRKTNLGPPVIINRIFVALKNRGYVAKITPDNTIIFTNNSWQAFLNFGAVRRLDGGKFSISISDNTTIVSFEYYRTIIIQLVVFAVTAVFLIFYSYDLIVLILMLCYLVAIGIQAVALSLIANNILYDISW
jgi:hypothetical protein